MWSKSKKLREFFIKEQHNQSTKVQAIFYDLFWDAWHQRHRNYLKFLYHFDENSRLNRIISQLRHLRSNSFNDVEALELGCGRGRLATLLDQKGFTVTGIDLAEATIHKLNKKYPSINFLSGDVFTMNLESMENQFDLIVSSEVFEHIGILNRSRFVDIIYRLLKKDGIAIITTPNKQEMINLHLDTEQIIDDWVGKEELERYFSKKLKICSSETTGYCFRSRLLNTLWKLTPIANFFVDRIYAKAGNGKYLVLVVRKN